MLYTAIIIEPRKHKALPFVLETFLNNLSKDWSFIIFHGTKNLEFIIDIINDKLTEHMHRIKLINLNVDNLTINDYNNLLKYDKNFYDCIPTEIFLIFQTDSIIFEKYNHFINNYLHYDYVGAPFFFNNNYNVGNGGLSLRKKSKMIEIMKKQGKNNYPEDVYFSCCESVAIHKPSVNDAKFFSIEEIFNEMSFGCHQPWKNSSNRFFLYDTYDEIKQLYSYNDILPPKPVKPVVAAVPLHKLSNSAVAPAVPLPKPVTTPAAVPLPKPPNLVKPIVAPAIIPLSKPPNPDKPIVAPAIIPLHKPVTTPAIIPLHKPVTTPAVPLHKPSNPVKPVTTPAVPLHKPSNPVKPVTTPAVPLSKPSNPVKPVTTPAAPLHKPVIMPKPVITPAAAVPPPITKGYKIARVEKEEIEEMYNYNNYNHNYKHHNNVSSSKTSTTQPQ